MARNVYNDRERQRKKRHIDTNGDDQAFADELNDFYARFETPDFLLKRDTIRQYGIGIWYGTAITPDEVCRVFNKID